MLQHQGSGLHMYCTSDHLQGKKKQEEEIIIEMSPDKADTEEAPRILKCCDPFLYSIYTSSPYGNTTS